MKPRPPLITREHRPGVGDRPAIGGTGVGPWLDRESADFLVQWLTLARPGIEVAMTSLRVGATFEEAIGLRPAASRVEVEVEVEARTVGA